MILVTGATGLVGSHLLAKLVLEETPIRALYRSEEKISLAKKVLATYFKEKTEKYFSKIEWFKADITDIPTLTDAFKGISYVYHCAGLISYDVRDYKKLRKINIEGTANVVNIALSKNIKKLCHVSSIASLGDEIGTKKITENSPRINENFHDNYSITKYGGEMEVWRASQEGLSVVIVNPGVIIGNGFWDAGSGLLFKKVANGLRYHFPLTTGFVGVEDVVNIMRKLMQSDLQNERFIIISENLSFKEVLQQIAVSIHKPKPTKRLHSWMVFLGWIFQSLGKFFFNTKKELTSRSIKAISSRSYYSNEKVKEKLNYEFQPIEKVIQKTGKEFISEN
ncbi:SDR family oxidoreductase [Mesonia maritima]|uniref:Nucleoside-diphosphate-sugar epimerase n=1 Tax=Mesonia maritima TaxID=1793873 RepID=A0ABU1K1F7_9FLAO|nr:SDR family oxidoreductase [Mesonia maritima]MDR6299453.1 nucleoside-diphosphate-sugar epimerase [Mesonia maritima]